MNKCLSVILFVLGSLNVYSQETAKIVGQVTDVASKEPLVGANIQLKEVRDSTKFYITSTDAQGRFQVESAVPTFYKLIISSVGYATVQKFVRVVSPQTNLGEFTMAETAEILEGVEIRDKAIAVENEGDTTSIRASSFVTNPDANAEDLLAKMPGIIVNGSGVQAQGEQVEKVLVDGREFFANDPNIALKSIPAEIIEKIQVFDQQSDQAQFTGIDDGNTTKTINIVTKLENRNGQFGRVYAGGNFDNQYSAGGNINHFDDALRLSLVGMSNNINKQNFSSEDLLGVASAGGRRGGRGGMGGGPGGSNAFNLSNSTGITETHAYGVNYSDEWGEKVKVTGSYFFNYADNQNDQQVNRENFIPDAPNQNYQELTSANRINTNHRFNMRLIYSINERNSIIFTPNINYQSTDLNEQILGETSLSEGTLLNNLINDYQSTGAGLRLGGNLLFRHRFEKRGRSFSIRGGATSNDANSDNDLDNLSVFYNSPIPTDTIFQFANQDNQGQNYNVNVNYTEPLGERTFLQLSYRNGWVLDDSDTRTYDDTQSPAELDTVLTNVFNSVYSTYAPGAGIMYRQGKLFMRLGASYQYATLESEQFFPEVGRIDRSFNSVLPNAMLRWSISRDNNLTFFYRSSTQNPSISQLQNVVDNSNPLYLSIGNPGLDQSVTHMGVLRFKRVNTKKSSSFFALASIRATDDYITNSSLVVNSDTLINGEYLLRRGGQISTPVNVDGYMNARLMLTYGLPLTFIKSNLNFNIGTTFNKIPGQVNGVQNVSNSMAHNIAVVLSSNISENLDYTLLYDATLNDVQNNLESNLSSDYSYQSLGLKLSWTFLGGFVLRNNLSYQLYSGFTDDFNDEFTLWNISLARKFLKDDQAELEFRVFDLLKQNTSISRTNAESYIEELRTNVLQQYFMLTFTYTIRNFKGIVDRSSQRPQRRW